MLTHLIHQLLLISTVGAAVIAEPGVLNTDLGRVAVIVVLGDALYAAVAAYRSRRANSTSVGSLSGT